MERLIRDARLEEWNGQRGIVEEDVEAFREENGKLWGLRRGGMIMVPPTYFRVFNIKDRLAAVRLQDAKLAVVDLSGNIVRTLGKGQSALLHSRDFAIVDRNKSQDYIDLLSGQTYSEMPKLVSTAEPQLLRTFTDGLMVRLKDPFVYGRINDESCYNPIREYVYFYEIALSKCRCEMDGYAVDTFTLIVFKGNNDCAYWLFDVHDDRSIDVIDRHGNCYHATPDGTREKLSRHDILERSQTVLKEIDNLYRKRGRKDGDRYERMCFRNMIIKTRLADKLKAIRKKQTR